jgi:predicted  nucleic acid-binding Zn ribbon protein
MSRDNWAEAYGSYPMQCVQITDETKLKGLYSSPHSISVSLQIRGCQDKDLEGTGLVCQGETEILDFIDKLSIKGFSLTEKIDFSKYGEKPVYSQINRHYNRYLERDKLVF